MTRDTLDAKFWVTTIVGAALTILLPLMAMWFDMQSHTKTLYSLIPLLLFNPVIAVVVMFLTSRSYGLWAGFSFVVLVAAFVASVFITYNASALVYFAFLGAGGLVGVALGALARKKQRSL